MPNILLGTAFGLMLVFSCLSQGIIAFEGHSVNMSET